MSVVSIPGGDFSFDLGVGWTWHQALIQAAWLFKSLATNGFIAGASFARISLHNAASAGL